MSSTRQAKVAEEATLVLGQKDPLVLAVMQGGVFTAVLVSKNLATPIKRVNVDFVGMEIEDDYVFGCGMDYKGYWRGLNALYAIDAP